MRTYKLFIRKYNLFKNNYEVIEKIVKTNDIYHEIGYIYCTTLEENKEIEEFRTEYAMRQMDKQFEDKINELVREVNKLRKEREGK